MSLAKENEIFKQIIQLQVTSTSQITKTQFPSTIAYQNASNNHNNTETPTIELHFHNFFSISINQTDTETHRLTLTYKHRRFLIVLYRTRNEKNQEAIGIPHVWDSMNEIAIELYSGANRIVTEEEMGNEDKAMG